jgi:hypothetical protein
LHDSFGTSAMTLVVDSDESDRYDSPAVITVHNSLGALPAETTDIRRVLDEVAQALSVIAPVTIRLREKLGTSDQDAVALEISVRRAIQAIRRLQPREADALTSSLIG